MKTINFQNRTLEQLVNSLDKLRTKYRNVSVNGQRDSNDKLFGTISLMPIV